MCLTIKDSYLYSHRNTEIVTTKLSNTAKRDMIVYKRFNVHVKRDKTIVLISPYQRKKYEVNMHYHQTGKEKFTFEWWNGELCINRGLHAYVNYKDVINNLFYDEYAVKCIIPKGSTYFLGKYGDIVSDNMIVTDKIYGYQPIKKVKQKQ